MTSHDAYEAEKLSLICQEALHLACVVRNCQVMIDYANENGIELFHKPNLCSLRYPGAVFGPDPSTSHNLASMVAIFEGAMSDMAKDIHCFHKTELEKRYYEVKDGALVLLA
jgi:hypothetical protein